MDDEDEDGDDEAVGGNELGHFVLPLLGLI